MRFPSNKGIGARLCAAADLSLPPFSAALFGKAEWMEFQPRGKDRE